MTALIAVVLGLFAELLKLLFELLQVLIGEIFEIDKFIARAPDGADELIQLQLHGLGVAVLCVLNKKHHQEGNDRGGCVDDKLPGIGKMERWPSKYPDQNHQHSPDKSPRGALPPLRVGRLSPFNRASIAARCWTDHPRFVRQPSGLGCAPAEMGVRWLGQSRTGTSAHQACGSLGLR